jgi:hypothetical protein
MLPEDAIVHFMAAYHIGKLDRITGCGVVPAVKVLDSPKAIAS